MDNINNWEHCGFPLMFCLNTLITAGIIPISSCQFNEVAQQLSTTCWWWWLSWRGLLIWTVTLDVTVFFHYLMNILNFSSFIDSTWFPPHCYLARYRKVGHRTQTEGINTNCYYMEINIFIICKGVSKGWFVIFNVGLFSNHKFHLTIVHQILLANENILLLKTWEIVMSYFFLIVFGIADFVLTLLFGYSHFPHIPIVQNSNHHVYLIGNRTLISELRTFEKEKIKRLY